VPRRNHAAQGSAHVPRSPCAQQRIPPIATTEPDAGKSESHRYLCLRPRRLPEVSLFGSFSTSVETPQAGSSLKLCYAFAVLRFDSYFYASRRREPPPPPPVCSSSSSSCSGWLGPFVSVYWPGGAGTWQKGSLGVVSLLFVAMLPDWDGGQVLIDPMCLT
jgi:hypothetical protein